MAGDLRKQIADWSSGIDMNKISLPILLSSLAITSLANASSHREAPNIARSPALDSTDFYAFNSYEDGREGFVTLIANYIPLQDAYGGPNYFAMDPAAVYAIHKIVRHGNHARCAASIGPSPAESKAMV